MKRLFAALLYALAVLGQGFAQAPLKMAIEQELTLMPNDIDARVNYKKLDGRDNPMVIIKVTLSDSQMNSRFFLRAGGNIEAEKKIVQNEVWFWLPEYTQNITLVCSGYESLSRGLAVSAGKVYTMKVRLDSQGKMVINDDIKNGYLRMKTEPKDVIVNWGETPEVQEQQMVENGEFYTRSLELYKTYYYRVESMSGLYEPEQGSIHLTKTTTLDIKLKTAYNKLTISTDPSGAKIYLDGKPFENGSLIPRGAHRISAQKAGYHNAQMQFQAPGDGSDIFRSLTLQPDFGTAEIVCADPAAELYLDGTKIGTGSWTGTLASGIHSVEARRAHHEQQRVNITVRENERQHFDIPAPEGRYGILDITSEPAFCRVYVDGAEVGETPGQFKILEGTHDIVLKRDGYEDSSAAEEIGYRGTKSVNRVLLKATPKPVVAAPAPVQTPKKVSSAPTRTRHTPWLFTDDYYPHWFLEGNAAYNDGFMGGATFAWNSTHIGLYGTGLFGGGSAIASAGLDLRLSSSSDADWHLYSGFAYDFSLKAKMLDIGLRLGLCDDYDWSMCSLSAGLMYDFAGKRVIPTFGFNLSALPYGVYLLADNDDTSGFSYWFFGTDMAVSTSDGEFFMGPFLSWVPTHLGGYANCRFGFNGSFMFSAGPVVRLTSDEVDLQLYGGLGACQGSFAKEFGIRFGWDSDTEVSMWDFSLGAMNWNGKWAPTWSVGSCITGAAASIGLAGGLVAELIYLCTLIDWDAFLAGMAMGIADYPYYYY